MKEVVDYIAEADMKGFIESSRKETTSRMKFILE